MNIATLPPRSDSRSAFLGTLRHASQTGVALIFVVAQLSAQPVQSTSRGNSADAQGNSSSIENGRATGQGGGGATDANGSSRNNDQGPSAGANRKNPDADWTALTQLNAPAPRSVQGRKKTRDEHATEHARQVAQARSVAEAARDFYTRHPGDARAREARKIEAISALRGVVAGDLDQEMAAVAVAKAFRMDPAMPVKDRFDVAVAMDSQDMAIRLRTGVVKDRPAEQKKLVENWRAEFGRMPEIESYAIAAARRADPKTATALALQVAKSPVAAAAVQREANAIKERAMLLGKPVNLNVRLVGGGELDLAQRQGRVTLVVVWSPSKPDSLLPLADFKKALPRGAEIVCLALGGTTGDIMRLRHTLPAVQYFGHAPLGSSAKKAAEALKVHLAPYVYVLNKSGVLSDFGPINELPALMTRAGVTAKKTS